MPLFEKRRKSLRGTRLPSKIECRPSEMSIKDIEFFKSVDDKKIIRDNTYSWYWYILMISVWLYLSYTIYFDDEYIRDWLSYSLSGAFLFIAILTTIYALLLPKKIVIFDRINSTITIGGPYWVKPVTIPFSEVKAFARTEYTYLSSERVLNMYRPDLYKQDVAFNDQSFEHIAADWAFFLWYMDKTRELPPGKALDPYRIEDAKRRQRDLNST